MTTRDEALREQVRRFYEALDAKLWEGVALGMDVAVCEDDILNLKIVFLEPGQMPPLGRRWTIYNSSHLRYGTA